MITKLIEPFLLPPGLFAALTILLALRLLLGRRDQLTGGLTLTAGALLYLLSTPVVAELLVAPLERAYPPPDSAQACWGDAIVVLGGGALSSSPAEGGEPALSTESTGRLVYGVRLARELPFDLIFTGGSALGREDRPTEAAAARRVALGLGIDEARFFLEQRSRTTWENARYVGEQFDTIAPILVTSALHMPRAVYSFRAQGIEPVPAPTLFRSDPAPPLLTDFLPSAGGLDTSSRALHEYLGLLYYRIRFRSQA
ncbi:MAG: YdcF family protein [Alkalispirochaetaceae bacterium]